MSGLALVSGLFEFEFEWLGIGEWAVHAPLIGEWLALGGRGG